MATTNFDWELPLIGASFGAWGPILNEVLGGTATPLGVDGVLKGISDDVDTAAASVTAIGVRVTALEAAGVASSFYARVFRNGSQTIGGGSAQQVLFNATSFDQGALVSGTSLVVPVSGDGVYLIRVQVEGDYHSGGDDSRKWTLELRRNGAAVALGRTPELNDGVFSSSGDITLQASYLDPTGIAGTIYTAFVTQSKGSPSLTGVAESTFMEAARLIAT